ncbi:MAG: helix-turn-helix domain-containing protein [Deltaproteobacteria bacterium]|jgi:transcriptional regulator with XRE-family HTH domain|nr:helix-turn-helix domain-containing protein [Deltaproteobacteria bacterium]
MRYLIFMEKQQSPKRKMDGSGGRIGSRMAQRRKELGLSQANLGKVLGLSSKAVCNYEVGRREPDMDTLAKLAKNLKCSADWLLGTGEAPFSPPAVPEWLRPLMGDLEEIRKPEKRKAFKSFVKILTKEV